MPDITFRPLVEVAGTYSTGLAAVALSPNGDLANAAAYGVRITWGVSGSHSWAHTKLGLDYRGSISHYARQTYYDTIDQSLLLGLTHRVSRRMTTQISLGAGTFSRSFGLLGLPTTLPFDPATTYVPRTDYFDNRTFYLTAHGGVIYQKTARLSLRASGSGFLNRRRSTALYGTTGWDAAGDIQYRATRMSTIGATYNFMHFEFTRVLSGTDVHTAAFTYSRSLTRTTEFSSYGGVSRAEMLLLQTTAVDPVISALLGVTSVSQIVHRLYYGPNLGARLSRRVQRGVFYLSAGHALTPGNGLFQTSTSTNVTAGYGYSGLRRWSINAQTLYSHNSSLSNFIGDYSSISGGGSVSRQLGRGLHVVANYDLRRYDSVDFARYHRLVQEASIGIGFTPGDIPLRLW